MQIVRVKYYLTEDKLSTMSYLYYSVEELKVEDIVNVPVRDSQGKAQVVAADVPDSEVANFRETIKTIPEGSILKRAEPVLPVKDEPIIDEVVPVEVHLAIMDVKKDALVVTIKECGMKALAYAEKVVVAGPEDVKSTTNDLVIVRGLKKKLEELRKGYVTPLNNQVDEINAFFKEILKPILKADDIMEGKVLAYNAEIRKQKIEAEEREAANLRLAQEQAAANHGEISVDLTPAPVQEPVKTVKTDLGSSTETGDWTYIVVNFSLVPDMFKVINPSVVNSFVKSNKGKVEIPGIKQEFVPKLTVRSK